MNISSNFLANIPESGRKNIFLWLFSSFYFKKSIHSSHRLFIYTPGIFCCCYYLLLPLNHRQKSSEFYDLFVYSTKNFQITESAKTEERNEHTSEIRQTAKK